MSTYAGTISEKRDLVSYDDDGNKVINLVVKTSKKLVGSIMIPVKRTIVLFRGEALDAEKELSVGSHVVFTEVMRNPRVYKTAKGNAIEVVDMVAESYSIIKPKDFKDNLVALMAENLPEDKLIFTDADRVACEKAAASADESDDAELPLGE